MVDDKSVSSYNITPDRILDGPNSGCNIYVAFLLTWAPQKVIAKVQFQIDQNPASPIDESAAAQFLMIYARRNGLADRPKTYCRFAYELLNDLAY